MCRLARATALVVVAGCTIGDPGSTSETDASGDGDGDTDGDGDPLACDAWTNPEPYPSIAPPTQCENCPVFVDVTDQAGLFHAQYFRASADQSECLFDTDQGVPNADCEPTWFSGGVAAGDVDGDGWVDLYVTRLAAPDRLYRNMGDGTFEDVAQASGLGQCTFTNGAVFGDLDDDGDLDLYVTALGGPRNLLFVNDGTGHFSEEAQLRGADLTSEAIRGGQSATLGDYDNDGDLDLHVNEWIRRELVPPDSAHVHGSRLLRNSGEGVFEDVTEAAGVGLEGIDDDGVFGFASSFADLDGDDHLDLAVAADFDTARLFRNRGDGTFEDITASAGVGKESNAMGSALADFDGDGDLDWYVTSIAELDHDCDEGEDPCGWKGRGNKLYLNAGDGTFDESAVAWGVAEADWAWGAAGFDADLDGDVDLFTVNGWPGRDLNGGFLHRDTPARFWRNDGPGQMSEIAELAGLADRGQGRGVLVLDYDRDGDEDLFVTNHAGQPRLLRNDTPNAGHWLRVRVEGDASNREGRGAIVEVEREAGAPVLVRHIGAGAHFLGEGEAVAHFGLGDMQGPLHEVRVRFPASASVRTASAVPLDGELVVQE